MNNLIILLIFLTWRGFNNWILYFAEQFVPYLGFFPYPKELFDFGLSHVSSALANFDGIHYLLIAHRGNYEQWEQAYFPLYSLLTRTLNPIFNNELVTGLLISNISFLLGLMFLKKYWILNSNKKNFIYLILFILVFPTSFFFGAIYTEGLFFLLFISTIYFLKKERYLIVGLLSIATSMTRLIGVFLIVPLVIHLLEKYQRKKNKFIEYVLDIRNLLLLFPILGLGIYCFYLYRTTGDPFMFLTSQPVFGANRSTNIILLPQVIWRYTKIIFTASHNFQYYVSIFELVTFTFIFVVLCFDLFKQVIFKSMFNFKILDYDRLGLSLFSFANLILPTLTGTFSSIPRYALFSISFFMFLSEIKNITLKISILIVFLILHILSLALFGQGYFIG